MPPHPFQATWDRAFRRTTGERLPMVILACDAGLVDALVPVVGDRARRFDEATARWLR